MSGGDLRFSVLGPVRAWWGDAELKLGSPQQRTVLAMLLLAEGRQVVVETLQDGLWDTEPPPSAVATVRTYLSRLRKSLRETGPDGEVLSLAHGYVLPARPGLLDLTVFEQLLVQARAAGEAGDAARSATVLRQALGLWRGAALAGIPGRWADAQRARLDDLRVAALEARLALDIDLGAHVRAAAELRELTGTDPLRERFAELLMLALYRSGRQADALTVFSTARHRLAEELGIDPGPGLRRMHDRVLKTDETLIVPASAPAPVTLTPPLVRPAQLPAELPAFASREADLDRLGQILNSGPRPGAAIATIGGMGGIGKTTLALKWAHEAADRFPDGQLYVNLRGFDPAGSALPAEEALRGFLVALGAAPDQLPDTPDAQAGLYRTLLRGRRVLIVLDNARDVQQVHPLLPGAPGCAVLITSRSPLSSLITTHDARPVTLGPLTTDQAHAVLSRRLGPDRLAASPAAAGQIIGHCAGLPLALALVAAQATAHGDQPLSVIAHGLGAAQTRLASLSAADHAASVRTVFSWSYHQLSDRAGPLFRLFSVYPVPDFSLGIAASIGGLTIAEATPLLAELTMAHLVTEQRPGRYALHDLLRAYAAELSAAEDSGGDRTAAFGRLADYYLLAGHRAHLLRRPMLTLAEPRPPGPAAAAEPPGPLAGEQFSAERLGLEALIDTGTSDGLRSYAWQLTLRTKDDGQRQGGWRGWLASAQSALQAALAGGDLSAQAYARSSLASAYRPAGRLDDALAELKRSRDLFAALGPAAGGRAFSSEILGSVLYDLGRYEEAAAALEEAVDLYRELEDPRGEASGWSGLATIRQHQGQLEQATDCFRRAAGQARKLGDRAVLAYALFGLGDTLLTAGDAASAREAWHEALGIVDDVKFADSAASVAAAEGV